MHMSNRSILCAILLQICSVALCADESVDPAKPRLCYSCEGINCQRTSMTKANATCNDLLDVCVTIFDNFAVEARGCYLDLPERLRAKCTQSDNPECQRCFGQLCNNKGRADFKCITCNDNSKCVSDTSGMTPMQCPAPTAPNSYCFVRKNDRNTERGCAIAMSEQLKCLQDNGCSMCLSSDGEACNSYRVSSGATRITLGFSSLLCLLLAKYLH